MHYLVGFVLRLQQNLCSVCGPEDAHVGQVLGLFQVPSDCKV